MIYVPTCQSSPLTRIKWYLVFTCLVLVLSQLPNLNSIAWISLIGAVNFVTYTTLIWGLSVSRPRPMVIYSDPIKLKSDVATTFVILNAFGSINFSFRQHNLVLQIQVQTPPILFVFVYARMIKIRCQINLRRLVFNSLSVLSTKPYIINTYLS